VQKNYVHFKNQTIKFSSILCVVNVDLTQRKIGVRDFSAQQCIKLKIIKFLVYEKVIKIMPG
jgi:hypothetical protein